MNYLKTKIRRMTKKYSNILMKDFGIEMSDSATNIIVICNGGLSNGITHEMICKTFQRFGHVENVIMIPRKSYCFVKLKDELSAREAFNNINGEIIWPEIRGPVFVGFVTNLNPSLFNASCSFNCPPGLVLIENFVTEEEEKFILNLIKFDIEKDNFTSELKHRKVKHYGYEFKFSINNVDLNEPIQEIPKELNFLWEKLRVHNCNIDFVPDQLTVNCYEPGQGIPPHVDTHSAFEDGIILLSLESTVVMDFRNDKEGFCNVILPRRSLCLLLAESRYGWTHGITPRKSDVILNFAGSLTVQNRGKRTSLTFRKTRKGDCVCNYKRLCDSYLKNFAQVDEPDMKCLSLKKEVSLKLEESYVHKVYEKIALHFSETRQKPWPNVLKFIESFSTGSILLDVGCGNGKYFSKQIKRFDIGCDSSNGLLQLCKEKQFECFMCNCLSVPVKNNAVDGCICIAVIHHLTSDDRRRKAIKEIVRILRSKGKALIYVWAKNQEKESEKSSYLKQCTKKEKKISKHSEPQIVSLNFNQEELRLPVHVNRTNFNHNDLLVPWKLKTNSANSSSSVHLRYYHVFDDDELKKMCEELEEIDILSYYYDQGNWCIILQKK